MKLMKSLLLGTAAGFAAVAGAQAADLPTKKAAPVEYVRICSLGGGAFVGYVIPGSDVCLKVGGFARWQYTNETPSNSLLYVPDTGLLGARGYGKATSGQSATGAVQLDARTQTEYGLLRSYVDIRASNASGSAGIDKAWVQLGGFQAGKFQSYYDFYADAFNNLGQLGSDHSVVGAAYTAIFGNFSAALSLEDTSSTFGIPNYYGAGPAYVAAPNTFDLNAGGYRVPDAVARLLYADSWGQVQLSGALHQVRANVAYDGLSKDNTDYGWAVQGGLKLNVPTFGPGDALYLQAAYANGALQYVGATGTFGYGKTTQLTYAADALPIGEDGSLKLTKGWNALAAFQHSWTPSVSTALWASYTAIDYASGSIIGGGIGEGLYVTGRDFHYWQAGAQANWNPVKNLTVSGTVNYINLSAKREAWDVILPAGTVGYKKSSDGVGFALRVQRDF